MDEVNVWNVALTDNEIASYITIQEMLLLPILLYPQMLLMKIYQPNHVRRIPNRD